MKRSDLLAHIPPGAGEATDKLEKYSNPLRERNADSFPAMPTITVLVGERDAELTAYLLWAALGPRVKVGLIGPDGAQELRRLLRGMAQQGCTHVLIRLNRAALARREWLDLPVSVAAPIGPVWDWDGLDSLLAQSDVTVCDLDERGAKRPAAGGVFSYSENKARADLLARNLRICPAYTEFEAVTWGQIQRIHLPMPGGFTVYHGLGALSCGLCLGLSLRTMTRRLCAIPGCGDTGSTG